MGRNGKGSEALNEGMMFGGDQKREVIDAGSENGIWDMNDPTDEKVDALMESDRCKLSSTLLGISADGSLPWGSRKTRSTPVRKRKDCFEWFRSNLNACIQHETARSKKKHTVASVNGRGASPRDRRKDSRFMGDGSKKAGVSSDRAEESRRKTHGQGHVVQPSQRSARLSTRTKKPILTSLAENSDEEFDNKGETSQRRRKAHVPIGDKAISKSGYTCRGRVKQKAQKRVDLVCIGERKALKGWFNSGYIFPLGFKSRTHFRSSVNLDALCVHECEIVIGQYWPLPTFVITAQDRPDEKMTSKSCTGCWSRVLQRINAEIIRRRKLGEKLPPPPKTAIAGPEYFGLIQSDILCKIEALDPDKKCELYWDGKFERQIATENLPLANNHKGVSNGSRSKARKHQEDQSDEDGESVDDDGEQGSDCYTLGKWSTLDRFDRYKRRCMSKGSLPDMTQVDENPLPGLMDPITMQSVVTPAISPYGHVMGIATWRACLAENRICPFTRNMLTVEQCTVLTKNNINKYRDKIMHL